MALAKLIVDGVRFPARWALCPCCHGSGQAENAAFSNGITSSEWAEMSDDEQDAYMQGGYDVPCTECEASGRVVVPDVSLCTFAQRRVLVARRREERAAAEDLYLSDAIHAAECRMGC